MGIKVTIVAGNSAETYIDERSRGTLEYEVKRFLQTQGEVWVYEDKENDLKVYVPRSSVRAMYVSNKEV